MSAEKDEVIATDDNNNNKNQATNLSEDGLSKEQAEKLSHALKQVTGSISGVSPTLAPVDEPMPLTGKEKAGVSLTWGVISVLVGFLVIMLMALAISEAAYSSRLSQLYSSPAQLNNLTTLTNALKEQQHEFRSFWKELLQLVLLNVLFPTLTALLGYVFGTSRNNGDST